MALQQYETIRLAIMRLASSIFDLFTMMDETSAAFLILFRRIEEAQKSPKNITRIARSARRVGIDNPRVLFTK